jgi:hypothetical protein
LPVDVSVSAWVLICVYAESVAMATDSAGKRRMTTTVAPSQRRSGNPALNERFVGPSSSPRRP